MIAIVVVGGAGAAIASAADTTASTIVPLTSLVELYTIQLDVV